MGGLGNAGLGDGGVTSVANAIAEGAVAVEGLYLSHCGVGPPVSHPGVSSELEARRRALMLLRTHASASCRSPRRAPLTDHVRSQHANG